MLVLGKPVRIELTRAAQRALAQRREPLLAEMELFFSCLIRKRVRFASLPADSDAVPAGDNLFVRFHPVMTAVCGKDYAGDEPPMTDFPIVRQEAFVPHWLAIDCRKGVWQGEFGFD